MFLVWVINMKTVLLVAEKPSLAQSIANILSKGEAIKNSSGAAPVFEYSGVFNNERVLFQFTSVMGHVLSLDFTAAYNNWETTKPVQLFDAEVRKCEDPKSRIGKKLKAKLDLG